jgi:adenylylsulfate kinase-like enzyme
MDWTTGTSSQYIFWLKGRAGTGKSTIALTIAHSLDERHATIASFFFKRGGGDLARSKKVIGTVAFQLAQQSSLLGGFICDALRKEPDLGDSA